MKISVNRHTLRGFELIHKRMGAGPVAFCVPPERLEWNGEATGRFGL